MTTAPLQIGSLLSLYPPAPNCRNPAHLTAPDQRIVGLCYHHADLRMRLVGGDRLARTERLFLVRLELAARSMGDKRRYRRHSIRLEATLRSDDVVRPCLVTDVGPGGLGIVTSSLPAGRGLIRVDYNRCPWLPSTRFAVTWSQKHGHGVRAGLRMVEPPEYTLPARLDPPDLDTASGVEPEPQQSSRPVYVRRGAASHCTCLNGILPR